MDNSLNRFCRSAVHNDGVDISTLSDEEFLLRVKKNNEIGMQMGIKLGWWESVDAKGNPVPFPKIAKFDDFKDIPNVTLGHVMHSCGLFPSISEAKRNNWNKPLVRGKFTVGKLKRIVIIE